MKNKMHEIIFIMEKNKKEVTTILNNENLIKDEKIYSLFNNIKKMSIELEHYFKGIKNKTKIFLEESKSIEDNDDYIEIVIKQYKTILSDYMKQYNLKLKD